MPVYRKIAIGVAVTLLIGAILSYSTFGSLSVCRRCGCKRSTTEFQIPLTPLTYWSTHAIVETEMSRMAQDRELVGVHAHNWVFVHGSGNGVTCALGIGGDVSNNVRLPEVLSFIECTSRYRDQREAAEWLSITLDPDKSRAVYQWLTIEQFPENGFESASDYESWRKSSDRDWTGILDQYKLHQ